MRIHRGFLAIAALVALGASAAAGAVTAPGPASARLRAFDSCPSFLAYVRKEALPLVGPWGLGGGVTGIGAVPPGAARDAVAGAPGAATDFSGTNVQEQGVDEPDLVKTDGRTLFVVSNARVSAFDVRSRRPKLVASLRLEKGSAAPSSCSIAAACSCSLRDRRRRSRSTAASPSGLPGRIPRSR